MNWLSVILLLFLLGAFAIGVNLSEVDRTTIDLAIDNATNQIMNITLSKSVEGSNLTNAEGIFNIIQQGVIFVGVFALEVVRTAVYFGYENPQYFTPEFIFAIMKLIVTLVIISLLIKPLFYCLIFIIMCILWLKDKLKKKS